MLLFFIDIIQFTKIRFSFAILCWYQWHGFGQFSCRHPLFWCMRFFEGNFEVGWISKWMSFDCMLAQSSLRLKRRRSSGLLECYELTRCFGFIWLVFERLALKFGRLVIVFELVFFRRVFVQLALLQLSFQLALLQLSFQLALFQAFFRLA